MKKLKNWTWRALLLLALASASVGGIIIAIIPSAVPTANRQGSTGTKFQIASGTAGAAGNCLEYDGSGNAVDAGVACAGAVGTSGATLFSSTTDAGPDNTGTETSLIGTVTGSTSIPANTFTTGAVLEVPIQGYFSLPAVADALTLKFKCGSTVIGSGTTTLPAGVITNGTFSGRLIFTARGSGASGAFMANGGVTFFSSGLVLNDVKILNTSAVSFDFTGACSFAATAQWGAGQSGEIIKASNIAAWIPGAPVTSVGGQVGAVPGEGNGSKVQMFTGSDPATNDCAKFDSNHNLVTAGAGCSSGGTAIAPSAIGSIGSCTTTAKLWLITDSLWDYAFCDGASALTYYLGGKQVGAVPSTTSVNLADIGGTVTAVGPGKRLDVTGTNNFHSGGFTVTESNAGNFTFTVGIVSNSTLGSGGCGLVIAKSNTVTDPITPFQMWPKTAGGLGEAFPVIQAWTAWNSATTSTTVLNNTGVSGRPPYPIYYRVVEDMTNRTYYLSMDNGATYLQQAQEATGARFTTGVVGVAWTVGNATIAGNCTVVSWEHTSP